MIERFHRPVSVREALALKRTHRAAAFLAGGTYVNSADFDFAPAQVIALDGLGLDRIEPRAGACRIGACVTLQALLDERRVPEPLRAAVAQVVPRNVRNAATLGGHVAARLPQSDVLPMLVALGAKVAIAAAGRTRLVPLSAYAARPVPGLIVRIDVPRPAASRVAACRNFRGSAHGRSLLSVAVSAGLVRGRLADPVVAIAGLGACVERLGAVERWLHGAPPPPLDEVQKRASAAARPRPASAANAALRRYEAGSLVALCLRDALAAKGGRP